MSTLPERNPSGCSFGPRLSQEKDGSEDRGGGAHTPEILQALEAGADRIMSTTSPPRPLPGCKLIGGRVEVESSGGITIDTLRCLWRGRC